MSLINKDNIKCCNSKRSFIIVIDDIYDRVIGKTHDILKLVPNNLRMYETIKYCEENRKEYSGLRFTYSLFSKDYNVNVSSMVAITFSQDTMDDIEQQVIDQSNNRDLSFYKKSIRSFEDMQRVIIDVIKEYVSYEIV